MCVDQTTNVCCLDANYLANFFSSVRSNAKKKRQLKTQRKYKRETNLALLSLAGQLTRARGSSNLTEFQFK